MNLLEELRKRCRPYRTLILACVLIPAAAALLISLVMPKEYMSSTSVFPVNGRLGDKLRLSGQEIAELYSAYGNGEDLDRVFAIVRSEQVFRALQDSFKLVQHYGISDEPGRAVEKAVLRLRKQTRFTRSEYGELILQVWDRDAAMAAALANAFVQEVEDVHLQQYQRIYGQTLQDMKRQLASLQNNGDSAEHASGVEKALEAYQTAVSEFTLAASHPPPAVLVVESAFAAARANRPKPLLYTLVASMSGLLTALVFILLFTGKLQDPGHDSTS
jgi:capsular polysaccharide biosynthesis protein